MNGRLRLGSGGEIDRSAPIRFWFDGKAYSGYAGDTLASALLAQGIRLLGRSFKYHRPRGLLSAGVEEPNALVTLRGGEGRDEPNLPATVVELEDGLVAESQNRWPSLRFDAAAINDAFSPLLPAGFYYKTFLWPAAAWHRFYEPRIRARAGLGSAPTAPDPDRYAQRYAHCDLLVVGAGAAGLAAAAAAAEAGLRVILCDENARLGASLIGAGETVDGKSASEWRVHMLEQLAGRANATLLPRTTAFGYFSQNFLGLVERRPKGRLDAARQRLWQVRARRVVLATGAIERPLVFADNDRPGVMLAGALQRYITEFAVLAGRRIVVCAADDSAYESARIARLAGAEVTLFELRASAREAQAASLRALGVTQHTGWVPTGTRGRLGVEALEVHPRRADGSLEARGKWLRCDLVAMAGGWTPAVHLHSQARGTVAWSEPAQAFVPDQALQAVTSAGACRAVHGLEACIADGRAAMVAGGGPRLAAGAASGKLTVLPAPGDRDAVKAFVDFQNDVTARDLRLAVREGFRSVEHVKRYTTLGMATDQGRTSNVNGLAIVADAIGCGISQVGLTTFRAPYSPVTFGAMVGQQHGRTFQPTRTTPIHERAAALGAVFEHVGPWLRARYFPCLSEDMNEAVARECRVTRAVAGMFDASTLGKIEVVGPDAAEFMNRLYSNAWTKLESGRCRYGLMLREDGFVYDDGVVGRLAADRFHVTTTTGGAPGVLHQMEDYLQTEFPDLKVWLTSTTEQWAVIAVQGPRSRQILEPLVEGIDLARDAFPHMAIRVGHICGVPTRLFRVSFTGELGFEVNVPSAQGAIVWDAIHRELTAHGGVPYGTETMHVLRAEKGYIIIGQETDGTATPGDLGLDWAVGKNKPDFVGRRSLMRPVMHGAARKQLVGLLTTDARTVLDEGAQLFDEAPQVRGPRVPSRGHVTSAYASQSCGRPIALAMLRDGRARIGDVVHASAADGSVAATVVAPIFLDPENARLAG